MPKPQATRELQEAERLERYAEDLRQQDSPYPISDEELLEIRQRVDEFEKQMKSRRSRKSGT